jgi:pyridinium-3,5-bisthiocarboxylic acid mononucleotide nickel chelatase
VSRVLYFDCFSGISGDMTLGALLDAGLPLADLQRALGSLALGDAHVHADRVLRTGVAATKFHVHEHKHDGHEHHDHGHDHHHEHAHPHRSLADIFGLIDRSALSRSGRERARAMFQRLGEAEAAIHGVSTDSVHLHEVGALDSIIDIVGTVFAMEWAGADRVVASPLNVGGGMVNSAHGRFPVPAPATVRLLGGAPVYSGEVQKELVTPTGALIVTTYADAFGPIPPMTIERVGYGAGDRDDPKTPNVLRVLIGEAAAAEPVSAHGPVGDRVTVIECEIDDMNPQIFGVAMEKLYAAGAVEVFYIPVQMKKNRPGTLLTVIAPPERRSAIADVIFRETTTIGLRHSEVARECLKREIVSVETPLGAVRYKIAWRDGKIVNATPEFEDVARLAAANDLSVKDVQAIAIRAYGAALNGPR